MQPCAGKRYWVSGPLRTQTVGPAQDAAEAVAMVVERLPASCPRPSSAARRRSPLTRPSRPTPLVDEPPMRHRNPPRLHKGHDPCGSDRKYDASSHTRPIRWRRSWCYDDVDPGPLCPGRHLVLLRT
ncbi:DUF6193 family natural product biosynthesis protein [Streptomyces sp. MS06]|uniref:DUF6193 family natural product biosynthesis protein n=1 Tax=Streptomyces sp. MS06 TaxID=3385974 RepID=UPI0039A13FC2